MKNVRILGVLLFAVCLCFSFASCSGNEGGNDNHLSLQNGVWSDGEGTLIFLDGDHNQYLLKTASGQVGSGNYISLPEQSMISYDSVLYQLEWKGKDFTLSVAEGTPKGISLAGKIFSPDSKNKVSAPTLQTMNGGWLLENGARLEIDARGMRYYYTAGDQSSKGLFKDLGDGKGLRFSVNEGWAYPILSADGQSITVVAEDGAAAVAGVYSKDSGVKDLSVSGQWFDTWYFHGSLQETRLSLRGSGYWDLSEKDTIVASGRVTEDKDLYGDWLALLDENGQARYLVSLGEAGQLFCKTTEQGALTEYYLKENQSN